MEIKLDSELVGQTAHSARTRHPATTQQLHVNSLLRPVYANDQSYYYIISVTLARGQKNLNCCSNGFAPRPAVPASWAAPNRQRPLHGNLSDTQAGHSPQDSPSTGRRTPEVGALPTFSATDLKATGPHPPSFRADSLLHLRTVRFHLPAFSTQFNLLTSQVCRLSPGELPARRASGRPARVPGCSHPSQHLSAHLPKWLSRPTSSPPTPLPVSLTSPPYAMILLLTCHRSAVGPYVSCSRGETRRRLLY